MVQLDIFDLAEDNVEESSETLEIKHAEIKLDNLVKVKKPNKESTVDPEDYYYLLEFQNKKGTVAERTQNAAGIFIFKVVFEKDKFGYFFEDDLLLI